MRRAGLLLLSAVVAIGISLTGISSYAPSSPAPAVHSDIASAPDVQVALADEGKRQRDRQEDKKRRDDKIERVRRHEQPKESRPAEASGPCSGLDVITLPDGDLCTHGPDPAPPGLDVEEPSGSRSAAAAMQGNPAIVCDGDGQSGYRVQVLYVHGSDVGSRYTQVFPTLLDSVRAADQIFQTSAAATGGTRNLRFVHDAACHPTVVDVEVPPAGDDTFGASIREVIARDHNRTDRIYLMLVDTDSAGICGISTMSNDDQPGAANLHNSGPKYVRVDAGCWSGSVAAHELMHTLGGVQDSAPHATGSGHCIDQYDIMCYRDGPNAPGIQINCPDSSLGRSRFDCGNDDYFHTNPAPGSYLATHWNPANNRFLIVGPDFALPPPPTPPAAGPPVDTYSGDSQGNETDKNATTKAKNKNKKQGKGGQSQRKKR